ncbi:hypothetical protein BB558_003492 [Smittium angustum]|uniref:Rab3 GTPase-activating protein catalytic subunit n=1 Tax=Smittium angustum TaxID=133377 RepID=A0A2U1J628_SMIAN|nr:hypothetical protein BB558_003492 [Smittium angustum]
MDDEQYEIIDYTTASIWERFVSDIEKILLKWKLGKAGKGIFDSSYDLGTLTTILSDESVNIKDKTQAALDWSVMVEYVFYGGKKYAVMLHRHPEFAHSTNKSLPNPVNSPSIASFDKTEEIKKLFPTVYISDLESQNNSINEIDGVTNPEIMAHHPLHKWTGANTLISLWSCGPTDPKENKNNNSKSTTNITKLWEKDSNEISVDTIKLLQSGLNVAIQNIECIIPAFVPVGVGWNYLYGGKQTQTVMFHCLASDKYQTKNLGSLKPKDDGSDKLDFTKIRGFARFESYYESVKALSLPSGLQNIGGLVELFLSKSKMNQFTKNTKAENNNELDSDNIRDEPKVKMAAAYSYKVKIKYDKLWNEKKHDFVKQVRSLWIGPMNDPLRQLGLIAYFNPVNALDYIPSDVKSKPQLYLKSATCFKLSSKFLDSSKERTMLSETLEDTVDAFIKDKNKLHRNNIFSGFDDKNGVYKDLAKDILLQILNEEPYQNIFTPKIDESKKKYKSAEESLTSTDTLLNKVRYGTGVRYQSLLWRMCEHILTLSARYSQNYWRAPPLLVLFHLVWKAMIKEFKYRWRRGLFIFDSESMRKGITRDPVIDLKYNLIQQKLDLVNFCILKRKDPLYKKQKCNSKRGMDSKLQKNDFYPEEISERLACFIEDEYLIALGTVDKTPNYSLMSPVFMHEEIDYKLNEVSGNTKYFDRENSYTVIDTTKSNILNMRENVSKYEFESQSSYNKSIYINENKTEKVERRRGSIDSDSKDETPHDFFSLSEQDLVYEINENYQHRNINKTNNNYKPDNINKKKENGTMKKGKLSTLNASKKVKKRIDFIDIDEIIAEDKEHYHEIDEKQTELSSWSSRSFDSNKMSGSKHPSSISSVLSDFCVVSNGSSFQSPKGNLPIKSNTIREFISEPVGEIKGALDTNTQTSNQKHVDETKNPIYGSRESMLPHEFKGRLRVLPGHFLLGSNPPIPIWIPETQQPQIFTEDMILEREVKLMELGNNKNSTYMRAEMQSAELISDMEAFKAANPYAQLSDFVRWHSPRDWISAGNSNSKGAEMNQTSDRVNTSPNNLENVNDYNFKKSYKSENSNYNDEENLDVQNNLGQTHGVGYLSARMSELGNLWQRLWENARRVSAEDQSPLFDYDAEGEKALSYLEEIDATSVFLALFPSMLLLTYDCLYGQLVVHQLDSLKSKLSFLEAIIVNPLEHNPIIQAVDIESILSFRKKDYLLECISKSNNFTENELEIIPGKPLDISNNSFYPSSKVVASFIEYLRQAEVSLGRAVSLLNQFPGKYSIVERILRSSETMVVDLGEKKVVLKCMSQFGIGLQKNPTKKEYIIFSDYVNLLTQHYRNTKIENLYILNKKQITSKTNEKHEKCKLCCSKSINHEEFVRGCNVCNCNSEEITNQPFQRMYISIEEDNRARFMFKHTNAQNVVIL